jgi:phosphopantothenoylcysteine synthetase/decarboxylase
MNSNGSPVRYAIVTGAPAAQDVGELVRLAQRDGWDVWVIASPDGTRFIDAEALATMTGHPVRSRYQEPGAPDVLPPADAMIAAPITCNSLAK